MDVQAKYYRVLNESEEVNVTYNSVDKPTSRQQAVQSYYPQIEAICILSLQCDIKLESALRIATQYGQVLGEVQDAVRNGETTIPLELFLVFNESKALIPLQPVVDFIVNYNQIYQDTGLYLDDERGDGQYIWEGAWEFVRHKVFPNKISRLESIFAFDNIENAKNFVAEYREVNAVIAQVETNNSVIERYDMQWITEVPENSTMKEAAEYAVVYWEGKQTSTPTFEILIKGQYKLSETDD